MKAPHQATTKFEYNPIGELLESTDPENNVTAYTYNMLGQLTERDHPDAGVTSYTYDRSGNLRSIQTAELGQTNDSIYYSYHYNYLSQITYPEHPENNVYYDYSSTTGQLKRMADASGVQTFKYGKLGELVSNTHTYVMPGTNQPYTFKTEWRYDSWNRIDSIFYPDNEIVKYHYNQTGQLAAMTGDKGNQSFDYIEEIAYDKFGSKTSIDYGNGASVQYHYDDTLHRLHQLVSKDRNAVNIQDIEYDYDNAGNIDQITNSAGTVNGLGGDYNYSYTYDSLYRLTQATGSFDNNTYNYELSMSYSASGNIISKELSAYVADPTARTINYENSYGYNTGQPHTIRSIHDARTQNTYYYEWDRNGNLTGQGRPGLSSNRRLCWDEENRLMSVRDDNFLSGYIYNAGGERVWKLTGPIREMTINGEQVVHMAYLDDKTLYQSPYMVVTDYDYTKHYYIEGQRISSKIGGGFGLADKEPLNDHVNNFGQYNSYEDMSNGLWELLISGFECTDHNTEYISYRPELSCMEELAQMDEPEEQLYFYHPDHLGSSSFITDASGNAHHHLQYMPFGETFIDQRIDWKPRFTFTDKEKDRNTGFSYFGARYMDSELSIWLSLDPLSDKYPSMSPYMYCAGNPIILTDPGGREFDFSTLSKENRKIIRKEIIRLWLKSKTFRKMYRKMRKSETIYTFNKYNVDDTSENPSEKASGYYNNGEINWGDGETSTLVQEMFHGYQDMKENRELYSGSTITDREAEGEVATYFIMNEVSSKKHDRYIPMGGIKEIVTQKSRAEVILMDLFEDYSPSPTKKELRSNEFNKNYQAYKEAFVKENRALGNRPKNYTGPTTKAKAVGLMRLYKLK